MLSWLLHPVDPPLPGLNKKKKNILHYFTLASRQLHALLVILHCKNSNALIHYYDAVRFFCFCTKLTYFICCDLIRYSILITALFTVSCFAVSVYELYDVRETFVNPFKSNEIAPTESSITISTTTFSSPAEVTNKNIISSTDTTIHTTTTLIVAAMISTTDEEVESPINTTPSSITISIDATTAAEKIDKLVVTVSKQTNSPSTVTEQQSVEITSKVTVKEELTTASYAGSTSQVNIVTSKLLQ